MKKCDNENLVGVAHYKVMHTTINDVSRYYQTWLVSLILSAWVTLPVVASAEENAWKNVEHNTFALFDIETMKQRGIDPRLAEYFRTVPRFTDGRHFVSLIVNGIKKGTVDATFNSKGELLFDDTLLVKGGLQTPASKYLLNTTDSTKKYYDFVAAYPQTEIELRPNKEQIFLVVPQHAILSEQSIKKHYSTGGTAAMLNYSMNAMRSQSEKRSNDYLSGETELGFNIGNWIVRSRQFYTKDENLSTFQHLYTYAQSTFTEQKAVVQAGEINIVSPLFSGGAITGLQVLPETALMDSAGSGALVEGIAELQSTVEVRQVGALIYSTIVPQGPFALTNIPLINSGSDLNVTLRDVNGSERNFVVRASSFSTAIAAKPGYSFSAGRLRNFGNIEEDNPWVATGSGTWSFHKSLTMTSGLMASDNYQSVGWGANSNITQNTSLNVKSLYSNAAKTSARGAQARVSLSSNLGNNISASISATHETIGYRDLYNAAMNAESGYESRYQNQYNIALGWSNDTLGSFNVGVSPARTFAGEVKNRLVSSWGQSFKHATVSATLETDLNRSNYGHDEKSIYVSVSIPLGKTSRLRTYASKRGETQRIGATYSETVNDQFSYRLSADNTGNKVGNYSSAGFSAIPRYASLDVALANGHTSKSFSANLSGGLVAHKKGITLSPRAVQDTFGIVGVGDLSGVKITTPNGAVWTDANGLAVVSNLNAYRENRIEVQTKSLPRRVDLQNGLQNVGAGRGSVNYMDFKVIKAQRVLLTAVDAAGIPLPKGASVIDGKNNFITTVLDKGTIFLPDSDSAQVIWVALQDGTKCQLKIDFPKETNHEAFYDVASAVCGAFST